MAQVKFTPKATQLSILKDIELQKQILANRERETIEMILGFLDVDPSRVTKIEFTGMELVVTTADEEEKTLKAS